MCDATKQITEALNSIEQELEQLRSTRDSILQTIQNANNHLYNAKSLVRSMNAKIEESQASIEVPLVTRITAMLNVENYTLRSVDSITDATGATSTQIYEALDRAEVSYVRRIRSRDGAELIGLTSRN